MTQTGIVSSIATFWNSQAPHETAKDAGQRFQWSVIPLDLDKRPCKTGGKHDDGTPKRLAWKKYQSERAHEKQIDYWHKQHNPSAWAIITGAISNVVVLDFDGDQGRVTSRRLGLEPHVRTGSGGEHVYFQHPGWRVPTLNSKSKQEMGRRWPGLDIRADGGYAAFCGRNESGPYIWLRDFQPEPLDILPDELRIFLGLMYSPDEAKARNEPAPQRTQTNTHDFGERLLNWALRRIVYQGRDNSAFDLACQLRDNDVPLAQSIMREFARKCPSINTKGQIEAFTEDDALAKLESANTRAARKPWEPLSPSRHPESSNGTSSSIGGHSDGNSTTPPTAKSDTDFLCEFTADDAGNGDAMLALFGKQFLWCSSRGWFRDTGTHWELDTDGAEVKKKAVETLRKRRHAAVDAGDEAIIKCTKGDEGRVNGCVSRFKTLVSVSIDSFDCDPDKLNCLNGVIDLRTGTLEAHHHTHRFTYCLPVEYDAEADWSEWLDFLQGVVHEKLLDYLQMISGYSLTGHTREEILFYLNGPTRSGKGTFAETFMALLPSPLSTMVDFNSFTAKRDGDVSNFDLAPLKPARMIFASESNRSQSLNPAKIKQLTGGDRIRACFKHRDHFDFRPQFKVWMMSNHPVNGDPEDDALWGRVRVIEFPNSFLGKEDKSKKSRLKEPEMLKGVLAWAVQGAIKWYALGSAGLTTPDPIVKTTQAQRTSLDYVQQWLDECCEEVDDEELWVANEDVNASYTQWCNLNNVEEKKSPVALSQSLKAKGHAIGIQKKVKGKNKKGVGGLYIRPIEESNGNDGNA